MNEIKRIPTKLQIKEFLITFEYETRKGYRREQQRKVKHFTKEAAKEILNNWLNTAERKSIPFSWCEENGIIIGMQLKKVRWRYDLEKFFNEN